MLGVGTTIKTGSLANKKVAKGNSKHTKIVNLATYTRKICVYKEHVQLGFAFLQTQLHHFSNIKYY